ncbi:bifunctional kinase-pyrophosphorylase [Nitzschia inconspicua]|uniref:Bifunctional kinase-pyrophosphorylase n=1 Tax=Nitzschia inconspicua TaxID=303405 RepID=A0A9K3LK25_9STRA|nr:bifunctional kinase-pyrophosphorylase [Nitzschia inconspicua]
MVVSTLNNTLHTNSSSPSSSAFVLLRPDEEEESTCLPPGRVPELKLIFLVSDATCVTARSTLLKSLAQFDTCTDDYLMDDAASPSNIDDDDDDASLLFGGTCDVRTRTFTFIRSPQALTQILRTAQDKRACVMYTMADPELRQVANEFCTQHAVPHVDLMGPPLDVLGSFLKKEPLGIPSRLSPRTKRKSHYLGDSYYKRIDAVEFALKADDGQSPWLLPEADIVLVGVSRSGKTPLSVVLSQTMSLKVANIPLVMEVPPPSQLLEQVDPRRIFCLTIAPSELRKIRTNRLERRGVKQMEDQQQQQQAGDDNRDTFKNAKIMPKIPKSNYADRNYLLRDLANARQLSQQHNWTEIDVTGRAVEETATLIVELFNERFVATGKDGEDLLDYFSTGSYISNQYVG